MPYGLATFWLQHVWQRLSIVTSGEGLERLESNSREFVVLNMATITPPARDIVEQELPGMAWLITDQEFTEKRLEPYFPTMQKTKPRTMTDDELLSLLAEVLPAGWRGSASEVARLVQ